MCASSHRLVGIRPCCQSTGCGNGQSGINLFFLCQGLTISIAHPPFMYTYKRTSSPTTKIYHLQHLTQPLNLTIHDHKQAQAVVALCHQLAPVCSQQMALQWCRQYNLGCWSLLASWTCSGNFWQFLHNGNAHSNKLTSYTQLAGLLRGQVHQRLHLCKFGIFQHVRWIPIHM